MIRRRGFCTVHPDILDSWRRPGKSENQTCFTQPSLWIRWCNPYTNHLGLLPLLTTAHKVPTQRFVCRGYPGLFSTKPHTAAHTPKHGVLALLSTSFFLCVLLPCPYRPCLRKSQEFSHRATVGAAEFAAAVNVEDNKTSNPNPALYYDAT